LFARKGCPRVSGQDASHAGIGQTGVVLGKKLKAYRRHNEYFQPQGPYLIESYVAERLRGMLAGEQAQGQKGLFVPPVADVTWLNVIFNTYERAHAIELTQAQRDAVCTSVTDVGSHSRTGISRKKAQDFLRYSKPP
jgi:hypothetical protein